MKIDYSRHASLKMHQNTCYKKISTKIQNNGNCKEKKIFLLLSSSFKTYQNKTQMAFSLIGCATKKMKFLITAWWLPNACLKTYDKAYMLMRLPATAHSIKNCSQSTIYCVVTLVLKEYWEANRHSLLISPGPEMRTSSTYRAAGTQVLGGQGQSSAPIGFGRNSSKTFIFKMP